MCCSWVVLSFVLFCFVFRLLSHTWYDMHLRSVVCTYLYPICFFCLFTFPRFLKRLVISSRASGYGERRGSVIIYNARLSPGRAPWHGAVDHCSPRAGYFSRDCFPPRRAAVELLHSIYLSPTFAFEFMAGVPRGCTNSLLSTPELL